MRGVIIMCLAAALASAGSAAAGAHRLRAANRSPAAKSVAHGSRARHAKAAGEDGFFHPYKRFHATSVYGREHTGVY